MGCYNVGLNELMEPSMDQPSPQTLLRLPQVLGRFPVSKSTWWAGVKTGRFPKPIRMGNRCSMWRATDIDLLIEEISSISQDDHSPN